MADKLKQAKDKIIVVVGCAGVGKATTIGNMIYKCGGIDMLTLGHFEHSGVRKYDQVVKDFEKLGRKPSFYTPNHKVVVSDEHTSDADCVILVVAPIEGSEHYSTDVDQNRLKNLAALFDAKRAIILINKLDAHGWSEHVFAKAVERTATDLHNLGIATQRTPFIPVSGLLGDNLIEPSTNSPWYFSGEKTSRSDVTGEMTLLAAIDMVLA